MFVSTVDKIDTTKLFTTQRLNKTFSMFIVYARLSVN